jgi:chaperonin GroEL (HSP60 family)
VRRLQIVGGYISRWFVTDERNKTVELTHPYILLCEERLSSAIAMFPLLAATIQIGKPLLIVAPDFEEELVATLVVNKVRGSRLVAAVGIAGTAAERETILDQIADFTGARVYSRILGFRLEDITPDWLGRAETILIEKYKTTFIGGAGKADHSAGAKNWPQSAFQSQLPLVVANKRGPANKKTAGAIETMVLAVREGRLTLEQLRHMKQKQLGSLYPAAGRTVLAQARKVALLRLAGTDYSDKSLT